MKTIRLLLLFLVLALPFLASAQVITTDSDENQETEEKSPFHKHEIDTAMAMSPDYMPVSYARIASHWYKPLIMKPVDTSTVQVHQSDPLIRTENITQNLGIYGQAHQTINYDYHRDPGFKMITLPYPYYIYDQNDVKFYNVPTSFTDLAFTFGIANMYEFDATHAQKYKGLTAAFDMHAYSNTGYYVNQETHNIRINAFVNYEIPSQYYGFTVSYLYNRIKAQENGGLQDITQFVQNKAQELTGYPVKSVSGYSKIQTHDLLFQQYVNIINKKKHYFGTITHSFQFKQLKTDYIDMGFDSLFYQPIILGKDSTHDTIQYYSIINSLQWSNFKPLDTLPDKKYFFRVAGGIMHEYVNAITPYYQGNTFTIFGRFHTRLFGVMDLYGRIAYSFNGYNKNDMVAAIGTKWMIQKKWNHFLGLEADFYRNSPDYIYENYYGNHNVWFCKDWPKQNTLKLSAFWSILKYRVELNYFMAHNLVRLNEIYEPFIIEKAANLVQLHIFAPVRIKGFGLNLNAYLQYSNSTSLTVPLLAFKASPYYVFNFLRGKLKMQIGLDLMYNTSYYADGYDPVLHQFYCQQKMLVGNYAYLDANITLKIKRISFFFRAGHFLSGIAGYSYFSTPYYPAMDRRFQIGINWKFYD